MAALFVAVAPTAVITGARISSSLHPPTPCSLLLPPRRRSLHASTHFSDALRFSTLRVRADSSDDTSSSFDLFSDLKAKWDAIENKSAVFLYGAGAIVAVWFSSVLVEAIDSVPLVPKLMELVGLGYTGWFIYHYLLYKSGRKELANEIEDLKKKIAGTGE